MVRRVGLVVAAALAAFWTWGAGAPTGEREEIEALRRELVSVAARLALLEDEVAAKVERNELAGLEEKLQELDDWAYERAVELGIAGRMASMKTGLPPPAQKRAAAAVVREARATGLDPLLVAAVIEVESTWRNFAVSPVGAVGLMQVMPATGSWFGERLGLSTTGREELFDPERNIHIGVHYLADLHKRFGRMDLALIAYNAGPTRARQIAKGPELERWLANYPKKVEDTQRRLRQQLASR